MHFFDLSIQDAGAYQEALTAFDIEVLQVAPGALGVEVQEVVSDEFVLRRQTATNELFLTGQANIPWTSLILVRSNVPATSHWCGIPCKTDTLLVLRSEREQHFFSKAGWADYEIILPDSFIRETGLLTDEDMFRALTPETGQIPLDPESARTLEAALQAAMALSKSLTMEDGKADGASAMRNLIAVALQNALEGRIDGPGHRLNRKALRTYPVVERALQHLNPEDNPFINAEELGDLAGAHYKTLQRAFGAAFGVSPYQFILRKRLNAARSVLRRSDNVSITRISANLGFPSASDFASHYAKFFGELPSETRRKAS